MKKTHKGLQMEKDFVLKNSILAGYGFLSPAGAGGKVVTH